MRLRTKTQKRKAERKSNLFQKLWTENKIFDLLENEIENNYNKKFWTLENFLKGFFPLRKRNNIKVKRKPVKKTTILKESEGVSEFSLQKTKKKSMYC